MPHQVETLMNEGKKCGDKGGFDPGTGLQAKTRKLWMLVNGCYLVSLIMGLILSLWK
jgi:hypothetical protein